jgi:hypothetical protein
VNPLEMLGDQHHRQFDAVCDVVIEQTHDWRDGEIRAELMVRYGAVAYASSTCVCHAYVLGKEPTEHFP